MRPDISSFAYLVVLSGRGSGRNGPLLWARVTLLCLWAAVLRKGLTDPNCPDSARGACAEPPNKPAAWSPLFLEDEAGPAPARLQHGPHPWCLSATLLLGGHKQHGGQAHGEDRSWDRKLFILSPDVK